jgi:hypothetical protein
MKRTGWVDATFLPFVVTPFGPARFGKVVEAMPDSYANFCAFFTVYPSLLRLLDSLDFFSEVTDRNNLSPMTAEQKKDHQSFHLDRADALFAILNDKIIRRWFSKDSWLKKTHDGLNVWRTAKDDEDFDCATQLLYDGLLELVELVQTMGVAVLGKWGWEIIHVYSDSNTIQRSAVDEIKFLRKQLCGTADEKTIREFISFVRSDAVETVHWWMDDDPADDSKFRFGPINGNLRQLAAWTEIDHRTLKTNNGRTSWHIVKEHARSFRMWFSSQHAYTLANERHLSEIAQNDMK